VKIAQVLRPCEAFIFHILIESQQKFISVLMVLYPCRCTDGGEISPRSVQRVAPPGRKNSETGSE